MIATQILDHIDQAIARLMEQYKKSDNLISIISGFVEQIQDAEDAIFALDNGRMLYNGSAFPAVGEQLDKIGELVNFERNGLDDETYLIFILGIIAQNHSDTTIKSILAITNSLFLNPTGFALYEIFPASVGIYFAETTLDPALFQTVASIIQKSLGAGIGLNFISQYDSENPFAFVDLYGVIPNFPNGNGFDNLLSPGQGGLFADLIYANPDT